MFSVLLLTDCFYRSVVVMVAWDFWSNLYAQLRLLLFYKGLYNPEAEFCWTSFGNYDCAKFHLVEFIFILGHQISYWCFAFTSYMYFFYACLFMGIVYVLGEWKWLTSTRNYFSLLNWLGIVVVCDEYYGSFVEGKMQFRNTSLLILD